MLGAEYPATCHHRLAGTATNSEVPPSMRSCPSSRTWAGRGCIWSLARPIIKLLWTSSFVLVAGGFSLLALALFYWMADVRGWRGWVFPFRVIGMNPIVAYTAVMLFDLLAHANEAPRGIGRCPAWRIKVPFAADVRIALKG